jgi:putative phage-type endonuclease
MSRYVQDADVISGTLSCVLGVRVRAADVTARADAVRAYKRKLEALLLSTGVPQRTPAWYDARQTMVTASDIAQALGCAKFGTQRQFFQKKCGLPDEQTPFDASIPPLKWGVMFEPVANEVYRALNGGVVVHEFGLLRHPVLPFIGASPDGITEDGVMLEIKCPWRRKINGEVPLQYYYQIQGQLDVCGLDECDYFECEFSASSLAAELAYEAADPEAGGHDRGVFLELVEDGTSRYVYPPSAFRQVCDAAAWATAAAAMAAPDAEAVHRWWRLEKAGTLRVERDGAFVASMVRDLGAVWQRVIAYRADRESYVRDICTAVEKKATARPRSAAALATATADASQSQPMNDYAFVDDGEDDA